MNKHRTFIIAVLVFVVVLGGFVFVQERIVQGGAEVILATRPVDPRDLFRGEYVILRYEIEQAEMVQAMIENTPDLDTLYVRLEAGQDGVATVTAVSVAIPDFSSGVWLTGDVERNRVRFPDLEQYFVPEGAGRPIERMRSGLHVQARVLNGNARVVGLLDENLQEIDVYEYRDSVPQ